MFGENKWAKEALAKLLTEKDYRFTMLRLRPFFDRWKQKALKLQNRSLRSKNLVRKRERKENRLSVLEKYFNNWLLRANIAKYINKNQDQEDQKKKFFAALDILSGTKKMVKRNYLEKCKPGIIRYLQNKTKDKAIKAIMRSMVPRNQKFVLRTYLNKWRKKIDSMKFKEFKTAIFKNMCGR